MRRTVGARQGPRSQRVVRAVLGATVQELGRVGYGGLAIDAVAREAGVHRTSIYRRWPSKLHLVSSLLEEHFEVLGSAPEGPDLRSELLAIYRLLARNLATPEGQALARVMASGDPELAELAESARRRAQARFQAAFDRALARGEIPAAEEVEMRVHLAFYGVIHWLVPGGRPAGDAELQRLLDVVLPPSSRRA